MTTEHRVTFRDADGIRRIRTVIGATPAISRHRFYVQVKEMRGDQQQVIWHRSGPRKSEGFTKTLLEGVRRAIYMRTFVDPRA